MPFNGTGVFQRVRNWVADAAAGIKIRADYHDAEDDGFAAGLTNCITKDGQTLVTQNIPFNSKRITGLADPVNPQDAATKASTDAKFAAGGTMTGDMLIQKDGPTLFLDSSGASSASVMGKRNTKMRWWLRFPNDSAETGANVGGDFDLHRYGDDAGYLGRVLNINRANGAWTIDGPVSFTSNPVAAGGAITVRGWGGDNQQGIVFFNVDNNKYLHYSGGRLHFVGGPINAGEPSVGGDLATVNYVNGRTAFTPVQQGGGAYQAGNKIYIGWDNSGLRAQVDGTDLGRFAFGGGSVITDGRLVYAADWGIPYNNTTQEPYGGAVMTGCHSYIVAQMFVITKFRFRYMQLLNVNGWYTVGYA